MNQELSDFAARLLPLLRDTARQARHNEFDELALQLFALQFKYNVAYRKICQACGLTPDVVEHWTQIPAVPTTAFKELELSCLSAEERTAVFHSSGTTEQKPSRHFHNRESLELYETSLWSWFTQNVLPDLRFTICDLGLICLTPPPADAPHSSLVHMFETIRQHLRRKHEVPPSGGRVNAELQALETGRPTPFFGRAAADGSWTLDFDGVLTALHSSLVTRHPALLLGTAFSFVHLLDYLVDRDLQVELPAGSRVMETGGYKNRSRTMPKGELHALITERFGVPPENIVSEYGMSELSSQAYAVASATWQVTRNDGVSCHLSPATCHFHFPPWARVQIVSPETGLEVADGKTGLIRVFDLANISSVMAVQTEDLGVRHADGFELLGRAQMAEPRGCSLMSV